MAERSTGISTRNPDTWVATFEGSETADGHSRQVQIVALTAGKVENTYTREVTASDSYSVGSVVGDIPVGDNANVAAYVQHSLSTGSCLVTPLLCNSGGAVMGYLDPKFSSVMVPVVSGVSYLSPALTWDIMHTGAWYLYMHVSEVHGGNTINISTSCF